VRSLVTLAVALCTGATLLSTSSDAPPELATAADINQFDPGNIISDAMFFDPNGLTHAQTADFIAAKGAACSRGADGSPCLKNFTQDTFTRYGDSICPVTYYGAAGETAASIIWRVAQVCRISPKVLLVLLQKEQSLITTTNPTARRYEIAAGMGCPDTAACDTQYYGFYNQVYAAARQYQRYATFPKNYSYRAGVTNTIQWSPNAACGTSQVYIANQATAGLYNYTPYRPNTAALRAGYGTGDSCSAYGNRNFWLWFTDWFGSTQSPGGDAVLAAYAARGGSTGSLGPWTTWVICGLSNAGCGQVFQNGRIYWTAATGAREVSGSILSSWVQQGLEAGAFGYPTIDPVCGLTGGGCGQLFQGGRIYSHPTTGTHALSGAVLDAWIGTGAEAGSLGYPTTGYICGLTDGGCGQVFQGGRIYTHPTTGTHVLSGPTEATWIANGAEAGGLRYPTTGLICGLTDGGCGQLFQNGRIYTHPTAGTHALTGAVLTAWINQRAEAGPLGYPTGDRVCGLAGGGCKQDFQGGTLWSHGTAGTHALSGAVATTYAAAGAEGGALGYPITGLICGLSNGGCGQVFQSGRIYTHPTAGTHALSGLLETGWIRQGAEAGPLGYPTGDPVCGLAGGGCKQDFQGGTLWSHPTAGSHPVSGAIATTYVATGAEGGALGYPITGLICGLRSSGCGQVFQTGRIYTTPATGTHALSGPIETAWIAQGAEAGPLGYPTSAPYAVSGGTAQNFQNGTLTHNSGTDQVTRS
jgi:uncharacterized protein with LGFP repeats